MTPESRAPNEERALTQKMLVDFLQADLDLCFTMLNTARMASESDHYHSALENARGGLQVIRKLAGRIEDPVSWKTINGRADQLESALESLQARHHSETRSTNL
jgi:hypothetical protein